jgi:hypothetical protein
LLWCSRKKSVARCRARPVYWSLSSWPISWKALAINYKQKRHLKIPQFTIFRSCAT